MGSMFIDGNGTDRIHIWKIQESIFLICLVDIRVPFVGYKPHIEESLEMIEQSKKVFFFFFTNRMSLIS